jgi:hypothetical protein
LLQGQEPGIDVASGLTVPQREEVTAPEQVKEPALTPAAEKYLDQAQDRKDPTKFTPKNTEKVTNQLKALADKNGIELKKTVTENGVEKEVDKTPQDIVDDLVAKRNRQIQMAGVARETPSEPYGPAPRAPRTAVQIGAEKAQRSEQIASLLKSAFDKLGLTTQGVKPEVVRYIADESGKEQRGAQAVEAEYNPHTKTITFASDIYNPNLSVDQIVGKMMDVLNHEVVHSLKEAGLFKAGEWRVLENYVKSGEGRKFLERAKLVYPDLNEAQQIEEAIAEASRAFNAGEFKPVGKPRNLFQRIINFFKGLFGAAKNNNTTPDQIFNAIRTGEIGGREAGAPAGGGRMQSRVGPATKKEAFNKLASDQRGLPESAMINAQKIMGGGVLSNAIEHVGDLTHRMSEYGGEFARENVPTKVARVLRSLRNPYGFEREHKENIQAAARFRNIDPNKFNSELDDALDRYANEHKKLEVYNVMQDHAREAAISLGEKNFNKTEQHLSAIERALKSGMYARQVQEYNPDYPRRIHPDLQKKQSRVGPPGGIKVQLSTPQQQTQSNEINERLAINSKYLSKLTEEEGLRQVKGMRGWFKEFIDPYHALGEGADKYRIASGLLSGNMYKNINMARDYAEPIGAAKADKKNIYDYLTTRDSSPDIIKDQKAREAAIKVKDIINKIGDEAVRMGLISPEQRERFRDQYLPRVLLAYSDRRKHVGAGKKPGFGYWRKSRADLTEEERTQLGEIQDPGFLVFESLFAPMRDMAILSFFNKINEIGGGKWVVGMNNKPVKGLDMNIQQVKVYADRLENAIKNGEISEDRIAESSAEVLRLRNAVEQEEERIGASVDRDKFIQMPKDTERYGPLAGLWVAKPIYRDVMGVGAFVPNNMSEFAALFADGGAVAKASSWFKLAKVAANPPTVFTNIISNALMMPFADVPYHRILPLVASTFKEIMMDKKGKYFDIAQNYGLKSTTLSEAELKNLYSELEKRATGGSDLNKITNLFYALVETAKKGGKKASDFYGDIETVFKAAIIKHGMESQGLTEEQAVLKANKYLFDYGEVHDSIKVLRNIPFGAPFLTWTYKMTPLLVETALTKPQKFIPYVALYYGIAQLATMAIMGAGGSEDDKDKLKKYLAKKTAENPFVLVTGPDSAFDFGKYMPFTNMYKFAATMASGKPVDAFREIGFFGGPVAELGIALTTGKDPFTNMDITPKGGSFADSVVSWTNFIANIFMPPFMKDLPKLGAGYAIDDPTMVAKSQSAVADTLKQIFGGTSGKQAGLPVKTEWEIAASYIGANIYHPSMQQFARNLHTMTKEMQDITIEFRRSMQDPDLSQSDRNKIIAKYNQLRIDKQKEIMNYVKDSNLSPAVVKLMTDSIQATRKPQQ